MASDLTFVEFACDQASDAGQITFKKMFGEYAVYFGNKVVALVCDNRFFLKPTDAGRRILKTVVESRPYPGAKPFFLIEEELEDRELLSKLIKETGNEIPEPAPRKQKKPTGKNKK